MREVAGGGRALLRGHGAPQRRWCGVAHRRPAGRVARPGEGAGGGRSSGVSSQLAEGGAERRDGAHGCGETAGGRRRWSSQTGERKSRRRCEAAVRMDAVRRRRTCFDGSVGEEAGVAWHGGFWKRAWRPSRLCRLDGTTSALLSQADSL